jgi:sec-independent protein translocase protein TatB
MFGIDSSEFLVVALVALLVIGPKDLPRVMREIGKFVAKGRSMTRHVRSGFDAMMREAELEEMQRIWAAQNEAIMKATALPDPALAAALASETAAVDEDWMAPAPHTAMPAMTGPMPASLDKSVPPEAIPPEPATANPPSAP